MRRHTPGAQPRSRPAPSGPLQKATGCAIVEHARDRRRNARLTRVARGLRMGQGKRIPFSITANDHSRDSLSFSCSTQLMLLFVYILPLPLVAGFVRDQSSIGSDGGVGSLGSRENRGFGTRAIYERARVWELANAKRSHGL